MRSSRSMAGLRRQAIAKSAVVQRKTTKRLWIPTHKKLAAHFTVLEKSLRTKLGKAATDLDLGRHHEPILLNTRGKPWTRDDFKASWAKELNDPRMAEFRAQARSGRANAYGQKRLYDQTICRLHRCVRLAPDGARLRQSRLDIRENGETRPCNCGLPPGVAVRPEQ
jgi:hypothetical protein